MDYGRAQSAPVLPTVNSGKGETNNLPNLSAFIDADPRAIFIVPIHLKSPVPFELLLCNEAFHNKGLQNAVLGSDHVAGQFRAWCQAVIHWRERYYFAGVTWTAFRIEGRWKCICASPTSPEAGEGAHDSPNSPLSPNHEVQNLNEVKIADARLASLYRMMEMSDVGTFEYSPEGKLMRANDSWYRLSLHPREKDTHRDFSFMDLVYPADGPLVLSQWNKLAQGIPVTFEMRWKGRAFGKTDVGDGVEDAQWVLSACVPILDDQGNLVSIAGNTIDINAQKRVQEQALQRAEALEMARASERKFSQFAQLAPIAIYILDPAGSMTYCNSRFFELTGHPPVDDYRRVNWEKHIVYPEDEAVVDNQWKTLLEEKQRSHAYMRLKKTWDVGDGVQRQVWVESQAFPELDSEGHLVSIFGTLTNISQFKWAEDIQRTRFEEALEAKRKQENFIDMTSHEMRNPLSAVIQSADSTIGSLKTVSKIISKLNPEERAEIENELRLSLDSLNTIISCSLHQKRVVDDILTLSKMDSNLMTISPVRVEPANIVSHAVHMFELECQKDDIELEFVEDPSLKGTGATHVMMDPSRCLQVLINLITNAIKFTRDRKVRKITVSLGASLERPTHFCDGISYAPVTTDTGNLLEDEDWGHGQVVYIWIQCQDTGCGLSRDEQGNLFTRFTQATPRTHIRYGGSGLGLFISKKLTELQGGAIGAYSEPDVGSTFAFFVATRIATPPTPLKLDGDKDPLMTPAPSRSTGMAPPKGNPHYVVLIVEDNLVNQKVLSQQLRKVGCEVYVANHGREALDFLTKTRFWVQQPQSNSSSESSTPSENLIDLSVILMDIEMPVMDGLACTREIRELQRSGQIITHIPIIAVSANARSEQVFQAREAGIDDTISKPFRILELMPKIETLVYGEESQLIINHATGGE
ncbi:uncharacterized protein PV09_01354 [Verruconis gallopava]|uniref:Uncharacterized protein n=1 Tax=Verruconis gallopava TaxID=253628 RepID=A0A0D1Y082_9PEZI|nr:uncharacterized protein PV09_01354 [Verruconis gallopava]KIW08451.1 hypothetical protein PV09_01354 [Verruconis gallopava]